MAAPGGLAQIPVIRELCAQPTSFSLRQAYRTVRRVLHAQFPPASDEPAARNAPRNGPRFRELVSLLTPNAEIAKAIVADGTVELTTPLGGMLGTAGALPPVFTAELLSLQGANESPAREEFYEIFTGRLLSLLCESAERSSVFSALENDVLGLSDRTPAFRLALEAMVGAEPDFELGEVTLGISGLRLLDHGSAHRLASVLSAYFQVPVEIHECAVCEVVLPPSERSRLPEPSAPESCHARLGVDAVLGERVPDPCSRAVVRLGPMPLRTFRLLLPEADGHAKLRHIVRALTTGAVRLDVVLVLAAGQCPPCALSDPDARLGLSAWISDALGDLEDTTFPVGMEELCS